MRDQLEVMPHVMFGGLTHEPAARLASRLAALLPGDLDHVFFSDSGSVSVEVAMKMAIQAALNRGERGRTKILAFRGGYHGDTLATMAVCDPDEGMHALFTGVLPEQIIADLPRDDASRAALDALLAREGHRVAAILVEPLVQGAGGMLMHEPHVLASLRACGRPARDAADLRRDLHRLRPHRRDVRVRGGGRRAGHRHALEGADGRHDGARRNHRLASMCSRRSCPTTRATR